MAGLAEILQDPNYVSANAETKAAIFEKHAPNDPNYANANPETQAAIKQKFGVTVGGAATGNPSIAAQGRKAVGTGFNAEPLLDIGGAAVVGGGIGAAGKEILTGAGNVVGALPYPVARTVGGALKSAGQLAGAAGRGAGAATGAVAGGVGETAGQVADMTFPDNRAVQEGTRFLAGGIGPETAKLVPWALRKIGSPVATAAEVIDFIARSTGNKPNVSAAQKAYIEEQIAALRGGPKDNQPLENVGSIMGAEGKRLMDTADQRLIAAQAQAAGARSTPSAEMADIGGSLRDTIAKRNEAALTARSEQYTKTETARDALVAAREGQSGGSINKLPEYESIVNGLKAELSPGKRSQDVQKSIQKVLGELENPEKDVFGQPKPISFQAIDDVRRKLGELFKGKPAEGYEALNDARGKELYKQLTDLQKKFAGGDTGPHARLLEDYHAQSDALAQFRSKLGKKATALDQYQEGTFATDASALPSAYFKTRASVQALKDLTGNPTQVNHAALEFANRELAGKDAAGVRKWLSSNSEWLAETGPTRTLIDRYATKLEGAERSVSNAEDIVAKVGKDTEFFRSNQMPAQRAVDLINSMDKAGGAKNWLVVAPAIAQSPQAKVQMVNAVRQVIADQATSKATADLFSRNVRPFIEGSGIGSKAEMDFIAQKLASIQEMKVPEPEKLGIMRRLILQGASGWTASAASRTGVSGYEWAKEKVVPE